MSLDFNSSVGLGASSPFLSSYAGLSDASLIGLAGMQASFTQQAPLSNQEEAYNLLNAAQHATDPALKNELLTKALDLLTPSSVAGPKSGASATAGTDPYASGSNPADTSRLTVNGNSIDTGRYTITASQDQQGQLTIHDNQTGKDTVVWGDPHVSVDGKNVAEFQKNGLSVKLDDGTVVHIQPTAQNGNGVSYINQVAVTKGDQAVTMSGLHDGTLHTSNVMDGQAGYVANMYDSTNEDVVAQGDDGNLYNVNSTGGMGAEIGSTDGSQVNLDDTASNGGAGSSATSGTSNPQLMSALQSAISNYTSSFMQNMLAMSLNSIMSTSGFQSS